MKNEVLRSEFVPKMFFSVNFNLVLFQHQHVAYSALNLIDHIVQCNTF